MLAFLLQQGYSRPTPVKEKNLNDIGFDVKNTY